MSISSNTRKKPKMKLESKQNEVIDITGHDEPEVSSTNVKQTEIAANGDMREPDIGFNPEDQHKYDQDKDTDDSADIYKIPERTLPPYNVPEKIILVFDSAVDEVTSYFDFNGDKVCPFNMLRRSLRFFIYNKNMLDARHEFALVIINDNRVVWVKDFTSNIETIINVLEDTPSCEPEDIIMLDKLFELIHSKVKLPETKENFNVPPPYIVRVLFTYGRSFTFPKVDNSNPIKSAIVNSPYFTFDILMTHEMPSRNNHCIKIFQELQAIDCKGFAYFFPVGRSASQLQLSMAKLLGHPLQRAIQQVANYTINAMEV